MPRELETFPGRRALETFGSAGLETRGAGGLYALHVQVIDEAGAYGASPSSWLIDVAYYNQQREILDHRVPVLNILWQVHVLPPLEDEEAWIVPPESTGLSLPAGITVEPRVHRPINVLSVLNSIVENHRPSLPYRVELFLDDSGSMDVDGNDAAIHYDLQALAGSQFLEQIQAIHPSIEYYQRTNTGETYLRRFGNAVQRLHESLVP